MSSNAIASARTIPTAVPVDRGHRARLFVAYIIAIVFLLAVGIYGLSYYVMGAADRPFSPKHDLLKPSGSIGLKLGYLGMVVFFLIFLYPLRKRWRWLGKQGISRHWLDFHILLGLSAPFIIAFHAAFKFGGFAGVAFWIMVAVSLSGIVGRYLYGQIPRSLNNAELSLKETQEIQGQLASRLADQRVLPQADLQALFRLPSRERASRLPVVVAIVYMMVLDVLRVFRVARLRKHALHGTERVTTLGGFFKTRHRDLERAIAYAEEQAALSKRILFLSRSQKVFHLWHVVHKPFSYAFAVLAIMHIGIVTSMGFGLW